MRLIDADALKAGLCAECELNGERCLGENCDWNSIYHIDHAPTVDALRGFNIDRAIIAILKELIEQLRLHTPRVLTLDEACKAKCVWYEQINTGLRPAKVNRAPHKTGVYRVMRFGDIDAWEHADEYGEFWRCWDKEPTDEQRRAIYWL